MASACVNNSLPLSPLPSPPPDLTPSSDFEFCLHDQPPVPMLPADQLFSQGFLLPLPLHSKPPPPSDPIDSPLFSPKAPPCSSRWRDLLRLKKLPSITPTQTTASSGSRSFKHFLHRSSKSAGATLSSSSDSSPLLNHSDSLDFSISTSSRPSLSSSSSSSSSSSQAHDHDDLPRLSLDSIKTRPPRIRSLRPRSDGLLPYLDNNCNCTINGRGCNGTHPVASSNMMGRSPIRKLTTAAPGTGTQPDAANRGVSVDSPRMNSSGRVVFQSLERSSSSPSSFNNGGGQRLKHRGVERSYSAGVRITPVLNVPISTLRSSTGGSKSGGSSGVFGLGQLFVSSPQKKENGNGGSNVGRGQRSNNGRSSSCKG
ncbi:hypothetical protein MLD38_012617 [Melastoma candidum]|uniref:Uncharacterized protein n=1 Tax=Melastoma candidum TaxID=119954 RepID=A0ACB9RFB4_9MYRT|nr:hypothetical protein MLD38_012617 [Melastoma candidum]